MNDQSIARTQISGYHAHVYYDRETKPLAERLAAAMADQFNIRFGGFHDGPVGPHPVANLQVIFTADEFPKVTVEGAPRTVRHIETPRISSHYVATDDHGLREVEVKVKGAGSGRESAVRALSNSGLKVLSIEDVTPLPHNGCRARKRRRV